MDYDYTSSVSTSNLDTSTAWGLIAAFMGVAIVVGLVVYVYMALVLMTIAKKTNTPNPWLAWIPIGNLYLMTQIAKVQWWTMLVIFLAWIPFVGGIAVLGVTIWWWWRICEERKRPGWWALLTLIPLANFIIPGIVAWSDVK